MKGREHAHHHYNQALFGQAHILSHEIITDNLELVRTIREGRSSKIRNLIGRWQANYITAEQNTIVQPLSKSFPCQKRKWLAFLQLLFFWKKNQTTSPLQAITLLLTPAIADWFPYIIIYSMKKTYGFLFLQKLWFSFFTTQSSKQLLLKINSWLFDILLPLLNPNLSADRTSFFSLPWQRDLTGFKTFTLRSGELLTGPSYHRFVQSV